MKNIFVIENDKVVERKIKGILVEDKDAYLDERAHWVGSFFLTEEEAKEKMRESLLKRKANIERKLKNL